MKLEHINTRVKVDFIANNRKKGITQTEIITIHCAPEFSEEYYDSDDNEVLRLIQSELNGIESVKQSCV